MSSAVRSSGVADARDDELGSTPPIPGNGNRNGPRLLKCRGMTQLAEFCEAGITATTISRMERAGEVVRLASSLHQLPDATLDPQQSLAEAARGRRRQQVSCHGGPGSGQQSHEELPRRVDADEHVRARFAANAAGHRGDLRSAQYGNPHSGSVSTSSPGTAPRQAGSAKGSTQ